MANSFTPIKDKCIWWRESPVDEDIWDTRVPAGEKRIYCSCFVEGKGWMFETRNLPSDCPDNRHCRYHILHTT